MEFEVRNSTESALLHYKYGLGLFTEKMPKLAEQFNSFTEECFKEGTLSKKQKQLIALGISLYSQDEYCIIYPENKGCLDQGASEQEIFEAVGVTAAFRGGTMSQAVTLVQECMQELLQ
ncbi:carboxymuconolactone decarboxylase family protein [Bacillus wiedmannii]|uniref:carboxymuconolactone decarboxylase family protein n=1 Tax=Bacillus wiedmannii TaxID=1890302 RepID=UPI001F09188F|nr:carboxymuconolactone decarboxylase family protein [Bacillus wiedmannii]MCX3317174.1 carboxymuconolactone decarboxylase family protein [Bacillus wiedmannii]